MRIAATFAAVAALWACAGEDGLTPRQEADRWALEHAHDIGPAEDCVLRREIRSTVVLDDGTIDFHMTRGRVLRNRLPDSCPTLGFNESFAYRTHADRLCAADLIVVRTGSGPGPSCALGRFQPVEIAPR